MNDPRDSVKGLGFYSGIDDQMFDHLEFYLHLARLVTDRG